MMSENARKLYEVGLQMLEVTGRDTTANRKKLKKACQDVDVLDELQKENQALYEHTISTPYPSPEWMRLLKVDKQILKLTQKLLINSRMYGWTPLARKLLQRKVKVDESSDQVDDPLEEILRENEERMKIPELLYDPMEEVLTAYGSAEKNK